MARDLVWKTWRIDELDVAQALNEMQGTGWMYHSLLVTHEPNTILLIASRFEEKPGQDSIGIPIVDERVWAAYQQLSPAEQQAMQVLLSGMLTRYIQKHEGRLAC